MDKDELIEFEEIKLRLTKEEVLEWSSYAKEENKSLDKYIKDSVEGQVLKSQILKYLDKQAKNKPWWEKRFYTL
tara:strand:+ start:581 stop:802 length:222 start_codon:yes stop_codon:yes gene_type:complete